MPIPRPSATLGGRLTILRILLALTLLLLAACGGGDNPAPAAPADAPAAATDNSDAGAAPGGELTGDLRVSSVAGAMHGVLDNSLAITTMSRSGPMSRC